MATVPHERVRNARNWEVRGAVLAGGTVGMLVVTASSECPGIPYLRGFLYVAGAVSMLNGLWPALFKIEQTEAAGGEVAAPIKAAAIVLGLTSLTTGIAALAIALANHAYFAARTRAATRPRRRVTTQTPARGCAGTTAASTGAARGLRRLRAAILRAGRLPRRLRHGLPLRRHRGGPRRAPRVHRRAAGGWSCWTAAAAVGAVVCARR